MSPTKLKIQSISREMPSGSCFPFARTSLLDQNGRRNRSKPPAAGIVADGFQEARSETFSLQITGAFFFNEAAFAQVIEGPDD
jgi:hypothetical protein